jgi:antitoxin CptB
MNKSKLNWQCRRGMKELDALLTGYLNERYDDAPEAEKAAFRALLELPDPDLVGYLLQRQVPESEALAGVVEYILCRTSP